MWRVKIVIHSCWVFLWALFPLLLFLFSWVYRRISASQTNSFPKVFSALRKQKKCPEIRFSFSTNNISSPPSTTVRTYNCGRHIPPPLRLAVYPAYISRNIVGESSVRMWTGQGRKKRQKKEVGTLPGAKLIITPPDLSSRTMVFPACLLFFIKKNMYGKVQ